MNYAIIKTGGKQYRVVKGSVIEVESIPGASKDDKISFDQVLLCVDEKEVNIGSPLVSGAVVTAKVIDSIKGEKIRVAKFLAKSKYRKVRGHRQSLSKVMIEDIKISSGKKSAPEPKKKAVKTK